MHRTRVTAIPRRVAFALALSASTVASADTVSVAALDLTKASQDFASPAVDKSVGGQPLSVAGRPVPHGMGTHAAFSLGIDLGGRARRFTATVGLDDDIRGTAGETAASVSFNVLGDGKPCSSRDRCGSGSPSPWTSTCRA